MKLSTILTIAAMVLPVFPASATVTLLFDGDSYTGLISGLANASGTPASGLRWGVVVSTTNAAFAGTGAGNYDAYTAGPTTQGFLNFGGSATDDYFIPVGLTLDTSGVDEGGFASTGGPGGIQTNTAPIALTGDTSGLGLGAGITTGDPFAIMWFANNSGAAGQKYGIITNAGFLIPNTGAAEDSYLASFVGNDPTRLATQTFATAGPIPEPSRALLLGFGAVGLMFRRRRA